MTAQAGSSRNDVQAAAAGSNLFSRRHSGEWQRFWTLHMYLAVVVLGEESLLAVAYFLINPTGPHREPLVAIAASSFAIALGGLILVNRLATRAWRNRVSVGAALLAGLILTACVYLDGGLDSPLIFLMALPIISASLALHPKAVVICCVAGFLELIVVAATDPLVLRSGDDLLLEFGFMSGVVVLTVGTVLLRSNLQAEDERLLSELTRLARTRPGRLTAAEMQLAREHAQLGADLLERVGFPYDVRQMVLQHHERAIEDELPTSTSSQLTTASGSGSVSTAYCMTRSGPLRL